MARFCLRFEGGQMPVYGRLPKKGFTNKSTSDTVDLAALKRVGLAQRVVFSHLEANGPHARDAWLLHGTKCTSPAMKAVCPSLPTNHAELY